MSMDTHPDSSPEPAAEAVVKGGLVAYLQLDGALEAAAFYARAFGATQVFAMPPDDRGRTMHVHLHLNGSSLMIGDAYPEHGHPLKAPQGFTMMLPVTDIAFWFERAKAAGCEVVTPVAEMFWGDLYGQVRDPFGVVWGMNQPKV